MTCIACLRILPDHNTVIGATGAPSAAARRAVAAFLAGAWSRPRKFGEIAPGAFLLSDPDAARIDVRLLTALAAALALEPVTLAYFEGDQGAATVFAALYPADLHSVMSGILVVDSMPGELSRLTPEGLCPVTAADGRTPLHLIVEQAPAETVDAQGGSIRAASQVRSTLAGLGSPGSGCSRDGGSPGDPLQPLERITPPTGLGSPPSRRRSEE